ncbi:hypothetical protein CAter10_2634 [Collimonas arenae]|nr:hypothetical protein CAter10_2634 [Collimonas arenae]
MSCTGESWNVDGFGEKQRKSRTVPHADSRRNAKRNVIEEISGCRQNG